MHPLLIAGLGVATVLSGILLLRIHPFLALLLGGLVVLLATPREIWLNQELKGDLHAVVAVEEGEDEIKLAAPLESGLYVLWPRDSAVPIAHPLELARSSAHPDEGGWMSVKQRLTGNERKTSEPKSLAIRVDDRLVLQSRLKEADRAQLGMVTQRLSAALAGTFQKIGLPITMAAIIGMCLLESGAAARLVTAIGQLFGASRTTPTLMVSGFLLGVPVFFDTVFYLLLPLAKAFGKQRPASYLTAVMAIIVGATMAHSLVPPTPGPLLVASELGISIGSMMIGGGIVGGIAAFTGYLYGLWCNRWMTLALPPDVANPALATPQANEEDGSVVDPATATSAPTRSVPLGLAILPLALPICCLGGIEFWRAWSPLSAESETASPYPWIAGMLDLIADPGFVLLVSALISFALLRMVVTSKQSVPMMARAIADAGTILLLTCGGGAFGAALKQLDIADAVAQLFPSAITPYGILVTSFILTGLIRIAQGSATVAMITTVGIVAPLVLATDLPFHTVYVALAIGCGSKLLPWMNDSGFWQVSTMTGMDTTQTLKTFSVALSIMGCVGFLLTLLGAWLLPLH